MVDELVERVARALCGRSGVDPDDLSGGTYDGGSYPRGVPAWTSWRDDAACAITAMLTWEPDRDVDRPFINDISWTHEMEEAAQKSNAFFRTLKP